MSDYLVKSIDKTKNLRLLTITAKGVVQEAQKRHDTWSTSSAVLGRTLVGALLLAGAELTDKEELTVRLLGNGPVGPTVATAKSDLTVKGYVKNPHIALPPKKNGHIDVKKGVGQGMLEVTKDLGLKKPYTGEVPIVSGEIAEDFAYYLTKSEQIPSAVGLSIFVNPNNSIGEAGGFMLQALPGASDGLIDKTIKRIKALPALSSSFLDGMTPEDLARKILGTDCKLLEKDNVAFKCDCSKEKYADILETLRIDQLENMINQDHGAELTCNFCNNQYHYTEDELKDILAKKKSDKEY
ncbi:Hsp33 family molecular chaperone HslO [Lactobacillus acetotolerans]|jgi:molecular chaperone Hsp33|uniref:33 kDa chaperonin n=1 Tax=Lactobacillus acetotolerans TaxID=1600 RepID=A0A0D6A1Q2_9LACO|nr:Hsp33 family molecular chaperone HslO [Lactobacillus acetotolerans]MBN7275745.1 Hsp33 family molecular chaperone HslO [Lactobacillus acetotolerans]QGV05057.1 Hsp33 family molecular chaperone HslO [Lactobacillus acetotolerans]QJD72560.1 Hsp33 family molecular chaperone HslO [Lactobacillus acetotolerans]BAQ56732.1 heat shock protein [Lactobacillus acetotolerans]HBG90755.1 Hsp33 family molecular chaperone HslO [Lactobacillus acetotolerans]